MIHVLMVASNGHLNLYGRNQFSGFSVAGNQPRLTVYVIQNYRLNIVSYYTLDSYHVLLKQLLDFVHIKLA